MSDIEIKDEEQAASELQGSRQERFSKASKLLILALAASPLLIAAVVMGVAITRPAEAVSSQVTSTAPASVDLELTTLDGELLTSDDLRGRWVMLDFWASWCLPCVVELPELAAAYEKWQFRGVEFIGVVAWDTESSAREFATTHDIPYPIVLSRATLPAEFGVVSLPEKFFISPTGETYRVKLIGGVTEEALDELLSVVTANS